MELEVQNNEVKMINKVSLEDFVSQKQNELSEIMQNISQLNERANVIINDINNIVEQLN